MAQQPDMAKQPEAIRLEELDFELDRHAEVPIGVQLAWALRARIRDGRFTPGQRLPGLRDLAEALGVNANTVRAVYQRLEREGAIDSQQGSGTFVAATPQQPSAAGAIAANAAREAHETGVNPRDVAAALYVAPESPVEPVDEPAKRRRQLRAQITALAQTLGEIEAKHPRLAPASGESLSGSGPRLLDVEELERVQTQLVRRLAAMQAAIDELGREPSADQHEPQVATAPKRAARARAKTRPAPAGA
jgi:DNA-binding transcriptional regulator YhcF (GntR family)